MGPERALLFLGAAAQGMAAAVPGEGALSEEHVGMAAAVPSEGALGKEHVGHQVDVFFAKPAPGASYRARLLRYRDADGKFAVQWLNEDGGQLEGEASEWMDVTEGVELVPGSGTPTRPYLQKLQLEEDQGVYKRKLKQIEDAGPGRKGPVRVSRAKGNREDDDAVSAAIAMINEQHKHQVVASRQWTTSACRGSAATREERGLPAVLACRGSVAGNSARRYARKHGET